MDKYCIWVIHNIAVPGVDLLVTGVIVMLILVVILVPILSLLEHRKRKRERLSTYDEVKKSVREEIDK
jgi:hypothetical protein